MEDVTKKLGQAYLQVQENQKAAVQKKLAKASASSEEGKKKVTLPKAPFDIPKEGTKNEATLDPVDQNALKGKHKDRKDKDIDNDGDVDSSDKYLHKRRKAVSKAMKKEGEVEMNPTKKKEKNMTQDAATMEGALPPVYAKILENRAAHYKKATPPETMDDKFKGAGAKQAKADQEEGMKPNDTEEKGHQDALAAGRKGPARKPRSNDNMKGDKAVINPAKDTTKAG